MGLALGLRLDDLLVANLIRVYGWFIGVFFETAAQTSEPESAATASPSPCLGGIASCCSPDY